LLGALVKENGNVFILLSLKFDGKYSEVRKSAEHYIKNIPSV
jgi:hypothetical protein